MDAQWYDVMTRDAGDPGSNPALGKVITLPGTGPARPNHSSTHCNKLSQIYFRVTEDCIAWYISRYV